MGVMQGLGSSGAGYTQVKGVQRRGAIAPSKHRKAMGWKVLHCATAEGFSKEGMAWCKCRKFRRLNPWTLLVGSKQARLQLVIT